MNILVTGGAGYIGSHTCKLLAAHGFKPVVYDNLVYGHREAVRWGPLIEGDIGDTDRVVEVMRTHKIEAVVHFAAYAYVGESVARPDIYYKNNVGGSLSLLQAMHTAAVKRIVFSSTCATYGMPVKVPIAEDHPQAPINPYGATKLMVERILQDFCVAFGIASVSLRYFNAAGADTEAGIGELHMPETHLIPLALQAITGGKPLVVFGEDYDTPDGTCIRDYIHVIDLAMAHVAALEKLKKDTKPTATMYNLGNGQGFSVKEVIDGLRKVTGKDVPHSMGPRRVGDPPRLVADARKARAELKWDPQHADLQSILRTAWEFHQANAVKSTGSSG